jgi:hypothetical protein
MSPPSSGPKNNPSKTPAGKHVVELGILFDSEDGGDIFLRNVG